MTVSGGDQELFGFTVLDMEERTYKKNDEKIHHSVLFDLINGCMLHCHIVRHRSKSPPNNDFLTENDIILFNIHHSVFDGASTSIFLDNLCVAYDTDITLAVDDNAIQYIDYSVHERQLDMTPSRKFWHSQLDGYDLERRLALPFDRHRLSTDERSGLASVAEFSLDHGLPSSFLTYASSRQLIGG